MLSEFSSTEQSLFHTSRLVPLEFNLYRFNVFRHLLLINCSFGWMYQVNSGVLVERTIQPNIPIKFKQPSCAVPNKTPCDPKQTIYKRKNYLAL